MELSGSAGCGVFPAAPADIGRHGKARNPQLHRLVDGDHYQARCAPHYSARREVVHLPSREVPGLFALAQTQDPAVFEGDKDLSAGDRQGVIDRGGVQLERGDRLAFVLTFRLAYQLDLASGRKD